jgi:RHS repeat-associated protein
VKSTEQTASVLIYPNTSLQVKRKIKNQGLMYYKARYYDSRIGRFLQQDSMAFPNQINGMNRMMYVEGNPVGFRDVIWE